VAIEGVSSPPCAAVFSFDPKHRFIVLHWPAPIESATPGDKKKAVARGDGLR
jgi:hypothetical protein